MKFVPIKGSASTKVHVGTTVKLQKAAKIDIAAADNRLTRADFIRQCIDFALEHMDKEKGEA